MTVPADDKFTAPMEVVRLRANEPATETALERARRVLDEREAAAAPPRKRSASK